MNVTVHEINQEQNSKSNCRYSPEIRECSYYILQDSFTPLQGGGEEDSPRPIGRSRLEGRKYPPLRTNPGTGVRLQTFSPPNHSHGWRCDKDVAGEGGALLMESFLFTGNLFGNAPSQHGVSLCRVQSFRHFSRVKLEVPRGSPSSITVGGEISQITSPEK